MLYDRLEPELPPSSRDAIFVPGTAQNDALSWLAEVPNVLDLSLLAICQRYGLAALYFATGASVSILPSWLSEDSECNWDGRIVCNSEEKITALNLNSVGLSGVLPPDVVILKYLGKCTHLATTIWIHSWRSRVVGMELVRLFLVPNSHFCSVGVSSAISAVTFEVEKNIVGGQIPTEFGQIFGLGELMSSTTCVHHHFRLEYALCVLFFCWVGHSMMHRHTHSHSFISTREKLVCLHHLLSFPRKIISL